MRPGKGERRALLVAVLLCLWPLCGCEPVFSHDTLSRAFNGVPVLPSTRTACEEYLAREKEKEKAAASRALPAAPPREEKGSKHRPFAEKRCHDCHAEEGQTSDALKKPKNELCLMCHKTLLTGAYSHGPAADGDCLSCHEPHESAHPFLLKESREKVCGECHTEKRVATAMHRRLSAFRIACPDCHNPHSGSTRYFLQ